MWWTTSATVSRGDAGIGRVRSADRLREHREPLRLAQRSVRVRKSHRSVDPCGEFVARVQPGRPTLSTLPCVKAYGKRLITRPFSLVIWHGMCYATAHDSQYLVA